jgi:hypothetical protein
MIRDYNGIHKKRKRGEGIEERREQEVNVNKR